MLIYTLIIILLVLIILFFVFMKESLNSTDKFCCYLRNFIGKNHGFFTIIFMSLFFIEQVILLVCVYYFLKVSSQAQFLISIFALVVITTATLEKFILEKRYEYLKKRVGIISYKNQKQLLKMTELLKIEEEKLKKER